MNVLITGASGFIGSHITDALIQREYDVTVCVRNRESAQQRWPDAHIVTADFSKAQSISAWLSRLEHVDVVINAVGIIRESGSQRFKALHTDSPCVLFKACEQAGVNSVIQISALGADATAFSQYHLSKRAADECLMGLRLNWTILLPSIVYGHGAKSMAFFRAMAALPVTPIIARGDQQLQPVHIDDVVRAVLQLIHSDAHKRLRIELVGPEAITIKQMYARLRDWLGLGRPRYISIPYSLTLLASYVAGFVGNSPMTKESVQMLLRGNSADVRPFVNQFGFVPQSFEQALNRVPAQQADRWYAGLYLLKPLLRLSIGFLWVFTGIVSAFVFPAEQSYSMLEKAGITGLWAPVMLYGAAATNVILGLATLMAYRIAVIGLMQVALIAFYTIIITFSQPELWLHPFGPISKNIPLIIATFIMLVLEQNNGLRNT